MYHGILQFIVSMFTICVVYFGPISKLTLQKTKQKQTAVIELLKWRHYNALRVIYF